MFKNQLAPIAISVYTRIDHFKKCILALQENEMSCESDLFIYSDAASSSIDIEGVDKVRNFSQNIEGFKTVTLINREINYGGFLNAKHAQEEITLRYGNSIFLEDDIIVSKSFLKFMNDALFLYKDNPLIQSVSGFNVPNISSVDEIMLSKFFNGWGVGLWAHKDPFNSLKIMKSPYEDMIKNKLKSKVSEFHPTLHRNLKKIDNKKCVANDVIFTYLLIKFGHFQIKPIQTLVRNIGMDGGGVNCGSDARFSNATISNENLNLGNLPEYSLQLDKDIYDFFYPTLTLRNRLKNFRYRVERKLFNGIYND